jgi:hypothetical protein
MNNITTDINRNIGIYANLSDKMKEIWIRNNTTTTKWMLDYLINITKD